MFQIYVTMATKSSNRLGIHLKCCVQSNLSTLSESAHQQFIQIQDNPYLIYKCFKQKVIREFKFILPWQPKCQMVSYHT